MSGKRISREKLTIKKMIDLYPRRDISSSLSGSAFGSSALSSNAGACAVACCQIFTC